MSPNMPAARLHHTTGRRLARTGVSHWHPTFKEPKSDTVMSIDLAAADKLLTTTRGVRRRLDFERTVPRSVIEDCIEVAMQAPVGASWNTHFIAVEDAELRRQIGAVYAQRAHPYLDKSDTAALAKLTGADERAGHEKSMSMHRWYTDNLHRAPVLMIVAMEGRWENSSAAERAGRYGSNLPAAWSFMLALRARGLGTCWTTLHIYEEQKIASILGIPEDITQTVLLPIGYYKGDDFKPARRPTVESCTHWDRW